MWAYSLLPLTVWAHLLMTVPQEEDRHTASSAFEPQYSVSDSLAKVRAGSLYQRSLIAYVETKACKAAVNESLIVLRDFVLEEEDTAQLYPTKIGQVAIEYLDTKAVLDRYQKLGRAFLVLKIEPVRNFDDTLVVNCVEARAGIRRRKLTLGVAGGYRVEWRYDCAAARCEGSRGTLGAAYRLTPLPTP